MSETEAYPNAPTWRANWRTLSLRLRVVWIVAVVLAAVHMLGIAGWMALSPDYTPEEANRYSDIMVYTNAARAVRAGVTPYALHSWGESVQVYHYHPLFALAFSLVVDLPFRLLSVLGVLAHTVCYAAGWYFWRRVAQALGLASAAAAFVAWAPAAMIYPNWEVTLFYWNINSALVPLTALLTLALIRERSGLAVLFALPLLLTKPHFLFPFLLPLVLRHWRFLFRTLALLLVAYLAANTLYVLLVDPAFGVQTLRDYATFLSGITRFYPWEGQGPYFDFTNHSWRQIYYHYFGFQPWVPAAVLLTEAIFIVPVLAAIVLALRRKLSVPRDAQPVILFVLLGYLIAMTTLEQLWELGLGIVVFAFLRAARDRTVRRLSAVFWGYIFYEPVVLAGYMFSERLIPHEVLPVNMLAMVVLYVPGILWLYRELAAPRALLAAPTACAV